MTKAITVAQMELFKIGTKQWGSTGGGPGDKYDVYEVLNQQTSMKMFKNAI